MPSLSLTHDGSRRHVWLVNKRASAASGAFFDGAKTEEVLSHFLIGLLFARGIFHAKQQ